MALKKPSPEDLRKIHAEVNQLVNQRFLLTTLAITVFGVVVAWFIPKSPMHPGDRVGGLTLGGSVLLLALLFLLYFHSHLLRGMLRVFTSYLVETKSSGWEQDWAAYRADKKHWAYTKPQTLVFMVLGVLAILFPVFLAVLYSLQWEPQIGFVILAVAWVAYESMIWAMGFKEVGSTETESLAKWRAVAEAKDDS